MIKLKAATLNEEEKLILRNQNKSLRLRSQQNKLKNNKNNKNNELNDIFKKESKKEINEKYNKNKEIKKNSNDFIQLSLIAKVNL